MLTRTHRRLQRAFRPLLVWCLLVAVPIYGVSGTLVELLGATHMHRASVVAVSADSADPMAGWVDMRRAAASVRTTAHAHVHEHANLERHHHDRDDAGVVTVDGAADDGGSSVESAAHLLAVSDTSVACALRSLRFDWPEPVAAAACRWSADGPARPPKT